MKPRPTYSIGIVAPYDSTNITMYDESNNVLETFTLNQQESIFRTYDDQALVILATNGILVTQYGDGYSDYDPALTFIPGLPQYTNWKKFYVPGNLDNYENTASIVIETREVFGLRLNGAELRPLGGVTVHMPDGRRFAVFYIAIRADSVYTLTHVNTGVKFGAYLYIGSSYLEYVTVLGYETDLCA